MTKRTETPKPMVGRYLSPTQSGRVTKKQVTESKQSSTNLGVAILEMFAFGLLVISLNYLQVLPGSTSPWYLLIGLGSLFGGFYLATKYH